LAVFGFARIPLLIHLGARLDDKVPAYVFQRQRTDSSNAWRWPDTAGQPPAFEHERLREGSGAVVLIVNLSGSIGPDELPADVLGDSTIYALRPAVPARSGPGVIDSPEALAAFDAAARRFLADVERLHGKPERIALFAAVPVAAAVTLGRVLMPNVSPAWTVYDRDQHGKFFLSLEVRR
ncbi:MAG: SAVED domain-containing protein, partial [Ilumatobacteraceae bacterium]